MDRTVEVLIGGAVLVALLAAFALYRRRQRSRVQRVTRWVEGYLSDRYGAVPSLLCIHCSDDPLWPVLVNFTSPRTGRPHRMRFDCPGSGSSLSVLSDSEESPISQ
jgi:hypothetical protein